MTLTVHPISRQEYLAAAADRPASYLQSASWPAVKVDWDAEHLAWRDERGTVAGVGLVLFRRLPFGRSLAVVAEGPLVDWAAHGTSEVLDPLAEHVRARGAVGLRVGPDVVHRRWHAATLKDAVGPGKRLRDLPADVVDPVGARIVADLAEAGWRPTREGDGMYGSTRFAFHVPLAGRTEEELFAAMNQQWRRAIRKAEKAGVVVERGAAAQLPEFHRLYVETAERDGFRPHPLDYFERLWSQLSAEGPDRIRLYLARHEGEALAGMVIAQNGGLAGYAYGGSAGHKREVYPSNAAHWRILRDLLADGADVYDMRGMNDGLDPEHPKFGVVRFKVGTGGDAVEYVCDWQLPLRPVQNAAVTAGLRHLPRVLELRSRARRLRPGRPAWRPTAPAEALRAATSPDPA